MALVWRFDLSGSGFEDSTNDGQTYTRLSDGKGFVETDPVLQLREAIDDPGIPKFGDPLDATVWPSLKLTNRSIQISCRGQVTAAIATFTYNSFSGGFFPIPDDTGPVIVTSSDVALADIPTIRDKDGNQVIVEHETDTQTPPLRRFVPVSSWETFRLQSTDPRALNDFHAGTLNNNLWNGYAARTVLFRGVSSSTTDGGDSFECFYRFEHRPQGWDDFVWYENDDGKVPTNLVNDVGVKRPQILPETNFGLLNISI